VSKVVATAKAKLSPGPSPGDKAQEAPSDQQGTRVQQSLDFGQGANVGASAPAEPLDRDMTGVERPELIHVVCGTLRGTLLPGCRVREEKILTDEGEEMAPAEFERRAGRGSQKKWKCSLRVRLNRADKSGPSVGDWLRARGHEWARAVLHKRIGVYWPEDAVFYWGTVVEFNGASGEHLVRYDDMQSEWMHLAMQLVKWESGAPLGRTCSRQLSELQHISSAGDGILKYL